MDKKRGVRHRVDSCSMMSIIAVAACAIAKCSTGVICVGIILLLIGKPSVGARGANGKWLVPALIVAMAVVAIAGTWVMTLPVVQSFTVGVLGKTGDYSGRLPIYGQIPGWFLENPIFGYGSTSAANAVVVLNNGATDCQEGLFQILLANGLVGAIVFLALCLVALDGYSKTDKRARGIYAYLVSMALASLVEINLGSFFLLGLSLMSVTSQASGPDGTGSTAAIQETDKFYDR